MADSGKEFGKSEPLLITWSEKDVTYSNKSRKKKSGAFVRVELDSVERGTQKDTSDPLLCEEVWFSSDALNSMAKAGHWSRSGKRYAISVSDDLVLAYDKSESDRPVFLAKPSCKNLAPTSCEFPFGRTDANVRSREAAYVAKFGEKKSDFDVYGYTSKLFRWKKNYEDLFEVACNEPALDEVLLSYDDMDREGFRYTMRAMGDVLRSPNGYALAEELRNASNLFDVQIPEWKKIIKASPEKLFPDGQEFSTDAASIKCDLVKLSLLYDEFPVGLDEESIPDGFLSPERALKRDVAALRSCVESTVGKYSGVIESNYLDAKFNDAGLYILSGDFSVFSPKAREAYAALTRTKKGDPLQNALDRTLLDGESTGIRDDLLYWIGVADCCGRLSVEFDKYLERGVLNLPTEEAYLASLQSERALPDYTGELNLNEDCEVEMNG